MHADKREEIDDADGRRHRGHHGHRLCQRRYLRRRPAKYCTLESMFVPEPVIKVAVSPANRGDADKLGKALARFRKEDPTFRVNTDQETGEVLIAGMGELHLEIYVERIRREYNVEVEVGAPKVSYREAPTQAAEFNYKHKKQTGGSGQYAHIVGRIEPLGGRRWKPISCSRRTSSAAESPSSTFRRSKGLPRLPGQGPGGRVPRGGSQGDAR